MNEREDENGALGDDASWRMQAGGGGELETIGRTKRRGAGAGETGLRQQRGSQRMMSGSIDDSHQLTPVPWALQGPRQLRTSCRVSWGDKQDL